MQRQEAGKPFEPEGHPGLRKALGEARSSLVFVSDDRAPHGIYAICRRWYSRELAKYLQGGEHFEVVPSTWEELQQTMAQELKSMNFEVGAGVPYNYGVWKPVKQKMRWIQGTRKPAAQGAEQENSTRKKEPPRTPTYFLDQALVQMLSKVMKSLKEQDDRERESTGDRKYWVVESPEQFARIVRLNASKLANLPMKTVDFTTMYTAFDQEILVQNVIKAVREAQQYEAGRAPENEGLPRLTRAGWTWEEEEGWTVEEVETLLRYSIAHCYTVNGALVRRQKQGMPMGLSEAPQLANLACYTVEKEHCSSTPQEGLGLRFIDDMFLAGRDPPPEGAYGMEYRTTSTNEKDVTFIGVRVTQRGGQIFTSVYDREAEYPHHITRYPEWTSTTPRSQLGGVVYGRLVFAQEICSHMAGFKEGVATVMRNAIWRQYPVGMLQSTWARFLQRRWAAQDIRKKELQDWFRKMLRDLKNKWGSRPPNQRIPQPPIRPLQLDQDYLNIHGVPAHTTQTARQRAAAQPQGPQGREQDAAPEGQQGGQDNAAGDRTEGRQPETTDRPPKPPADRAGREQGAERTEEGDEQPPSAEQGQPETTDRQPNPTNPPKEPNPPAGMPNALRRPDAQAEPCPAAPEGPEVEGIEPEQGANDPPPISPHKPTPLTPKPRPKPPAVEPQDTTADYRAWGKAHRGTVPDRCIAQVVGTRPMQNDGLWALRRRAEQELQEDIYHRRMQKEDQEPRPTAGGRREEEPRGVDPGVDLEEEGAFEALLAELDNEEMEVDTEHQPPPLPPPPPPPPTAAPPAEQQGQLVLRGQAQDRTADLSKLTPTEEELGQNLLRMLRAARQREEEGQESQQPQPLQETLDKMSKQWQEDLRQCIREMRDTWMYSRPMYIPTPVPYPMQQAATEGRTTTGPNHLPLTINNTMNLPQLLGWPATPRQEDRAEAARLAWQPQAHLEAPALAIEWHEEAAQASQRESRATSKRKEKAQQPSRRERRPTRPYQSEEVAQAQKQQEEQLRQQRKRRRTATPTTPTSQEAPTGQAPPTPPPPPPFQPQPPRE